MSNRRQHGFIVREDAMVSIVTAAHSDIGKR
jgi:hypothetical protein